MVKSSEDLNRNKLAQIGPIVVIKNKNQGSTHRETSGIQTISDSQNTTIYGGKKGGLSTNHDSTSLQPINNNYMKGYATGFHHMKHKAPGNSKQLLINENSNLSSKRLLKKPMYTFRGNGAKRHRDYSNEILTEDKEKKLNYSTLARKPQLL